MRNMYLVYDRRTGDVLETHVKYVLGSDEPVAMTEDEVRALTAREDAGIARVPDGLDVRSRTHRPVVDPASGGVTLVAAGEAAPKAPARKPAKAAAKTASRTRRSRS